MFHDFCSANFTTLPAFLRVRTAFFTESCSSFVQYVCRIKRAISASAWVYSLLPLRDTSLILSEKRPQYHRKTTSFVCRPFMNIKAIPLRFSSLQSAHCRSALSADLRCLTSPLDHRFCRPSSLLAVSNLHTSRCALWFPFKSSARLVIRFTMPFQWITLVSCKDESIAISRNRRLVDSEKSLGE